MPSNPLDPTPTAGLDELLAFDFSLFLAVDLGSLDPVELSPLDQDLYPDLTGLDPAWS